MASTSAPPRSGLAALSRQDTTSTATTSGVPRPRFRWGTRIALPAAIVTALAALLAWSARDALRPAVEVHVVPVVAKARAAAGQDMADAGETADARIAVSPSRETTLVQAPGWIEPAPFAITVPALTDGVVKEVLFLEGQEVKAGEVLARLIDDDAVLTVRRAEAELAERIAATRRAAAERDSADALAAEVRDEVERKNTLTVDGSISEAAVTRLRLRLRALEADVSAAAATVAAMEAAERVQAVALDQARLALDRTEIRSPVAGVVLARSIEPGTRLMLSGPNSGEAGVARVYDPSRLQARVDVPLADAAKVYIGASARIVSEALPDTTFEGTVARVVHEANIQRNTVQFKVSIKSPAAALKPEMLVRVRILANSEGGDRGGGRESDHHGSLDTGLVLLLPESALLERRENAAAAWFVARDSRGGTIAARRRLTLGASHDDGFIEIVSGALPTDRVIADPPASLSEGVRIRVAGEAGTHTATEEAS